MTAILRAAGASKRWAPDTVVYVPELVVDAGVVCALSGPSGCGKSTVLGLFAGWIRPDTGIVEVDEMTPSIDGPWSSIAIVPQALGLLAELTVRENVTEFAPATPRHWIDEILDRTDVLELAERGVQEISAGQRQRVAIARALAASPRALLVDEPTSFQDDHHAASIVRCLTEVSWRGTAVLIASHDPAVINAAHIVHSMGSR